MDKNNGTGDFPRDLQFYKFSAYGFLKNLRFFEPFLILFFLEVGINYVQIGILIAVRELTTNLLELPTGMIADSFGRRKSMIFSFVAYILSFITFTFFPGFYYYLGAMVLFSCGDAFRTGTHKAMILTYLEIKGIKHLKVHYYGHTRAASQMGSALSSLLAMGLVFFHGSFRWVFLVSVIPYILELFLMISYPRELDGDIAPVSGKMFPELKKRFRATAGDFAHLFRRPGTLTALLASAVYSGLFKGTRDYLQPLLKQFALALPFLLTLSVDQRSIILVGTTYFFLYLVTSYASKRSGRVAEKFKNLPAAVNLTYVVGTLFVCLSGAAYQLERFELAVLLFIVLYIAQNIRKPITVGLISDRVRSRILATGLSGESQLKALFAALFSFLMGAAAQYLGLGIALILIGGLALALYPAVRIKHRE